MLFNQVIKKQYFRTLTPHDSDTVTTASMKITPEATLEVPFEVFCPTLPPKKTVSVVHKSPILKVLVPVSLETPNPGLWEEQLISSYPKNIP